MGCRSTGVLIALYLRTAATSSGCQLRKVGFDFKISVDVLKYWVLTALCFLSLRLKISLTVERASTRANAYVNWMLLASTSTRM